MSLRVYLCRIVPPELADRAYDVSYSDYAALRRFQSTGLLCVAETQIGKNCLSSSWLDHYDASIDAGANLGDLCLVLPDELQAKLLDHVDVNNPEPYLGLDAHFSYAALEVEPWDFIWISW
jgi:hypothetical protein